MHNIDTRCSRSMSIASCFVCRVLRGRGNSMVTTGNQMAHWLNKVELQTLDCSQFLTQLLFGRCQKTNVLSQYDLIDILQHDTLRNYVNTPYYCECTLLCFIVKIGQYITVFFHQELAYITVTKTNGRTDWRSNVTVTLNILGLPYFQLWINSTSIKFFRKTNIFLVLNLFNNFCFT